VQPGATCGWTAGNYSTFSNCEATQCPQPPAGAWTSTCPAVVQDGEPCSPTANCIPPASCTDAGVCGWTRASSCH
jgi:hypothetical protein